MHCHNCIIQTEDSCSKIFVWYVFSNCSIKRSRILFVNCVSISKTACTYNAYFDLKKKECKRYIVLFQKLSPWVTQRYTICKFYVTEGHITFSEILILHLFKWTRCMLISRYTTLLRKRSERVTDIECTYLRYF